MPLSPWVPDLTALELLASVAMTGSFGRAAQEHGISQPAVSSRIRHLERRLGLPLVERSTRGSKLTAEGAMVVEWARALLDTAGQLEAGVAALRRSREGKLRVAASLTIAEYLMPGWLVTFSRDHTEIEVSLGVGNSVEVERRVLGDEADIGFVETPAVPATLTGRVVGRDHLSVVVAPGHPWARRRRPVTATELARTALVQREGGSGTRETYAQALDGLGLEPADPAVVLSSTTAIKRAVGHGAGPAVLSSLTITEDVTVGRLVCVPIEGVSFERKLTAVWPKGRQLVGPARDLVVAASRSAGAG